MPRLFYYIFSALLLIGCSLDTLEKKPTRTLKMVQPGNHSLSIKVDNLERHYIVHVPKGYDTQKSISVVMMFHGGGGTGTAAMNETRWAEKSDQSGFIAVFPEASRPNMSIPANFRTNPQTWNDGSGRFQSGVDDVKFVNNLIDDLGTRFKIDHKRIYATGFSNGASMSFHLGVHLSKRLAAIAPVSGALWTDDPRPKRPISLFYLTGKQDPLNPLDGGIPRLAIGGRGLGGRTKPPVKEHIQKWVKALNCSKEPQTIYDRDGVIGLRYGHGNQGTEVVYYTVDEMGHTWPGGMSILPEAWVGKLTDKIKANDLIWDFFQKHPMP